MRKTSLPLLLATALLLAAAPAQAARLEGVDVSPKTVTAGDSVVITIVLDRPGAAPTLRTLGNPQALHIAAQPIAMYNRATWTKQYTTKHFTDQTRTVQIRADWGGRSRVVHLTVQPAPASSPPPAPGPTSAANYRFDSPQEISQLVRYAQRNGFRFRASVLPGSLGRCDLSLRPRVRLLPMVPPVPLIVDVPRCQAVFFERRRLASGWSLETVDFSGGAGDSAHAIEWKWVKSPKKRHGDASFAILTEEALPNDYVDLVEVVLRGPAGRNWREAFDNSRR